MKCGQLLLSRKLETVGTLREQVAEIIEWPKKLMQEQLHFNQEAIRHKSLAPRKICAKFVHAFSWMSKRSVQKCQISPFFLNCIVNGDEFCEFPTIVKQNFR
jgi:hypothetical protein